MFPRSIGAALAGRGRLTVIDDDGAVVRPGVATDDQALGQAMPDGDPLRMASRAKG